MSLTYPDILSSIALFLSLVLAIIELKRRLHKLQLRITGVDGIGGQATTIYVLIHLTVVNPSSMPKTIYGIRFESRGKYHVYEVPGKPDLLQSLVTFQPPPGILGSPMQVRLDDTASFPLDVEPHHSKKVYLAVAFSPVSPPLSGEQRPRAETYGYLIAFDHRLKQITKIPILVPLFPPS